jgi:cytoskeletal protein CcmA (bactofilin family)
MFSTADRTRDSAIEQIEGLRRTFHSGRLVSVIGADATVVGNIDCAGDLQIFGTVEGDVRGRTLVVEAGGLVEGRVFADRLLVGGTVNGAVTATDVGVEGTARVVGNITHNNLMIEPGAFLEGRRPWRPRPVKR